MWYDTRKWVVTNAAFFRQFRQGRRRLTTVPFRCVVETGYCGNVVIPEETREYARSQGIEIVASARERRCRHKESA